MTDDDADEAARTAPQVDAGEGKKHVAKVVRSGAWDGGRLLEKAASHLEFCGNIACGHQAMMADLHEAFWQDVQHEPAQELIWRDGDDVGATGAKGDAARVEGNEATVG